MKKVILLIITFIMVLFNAHVVKSESVQNYFKRAERFYKAGYNEIGDRIMEEAINKYPTDRYVLRYKGMKLFSEGKLKESYSVFQEAVKYNPDYGEGYWFLGMAEEDFNNLEKAEEYFKKAIDLDPHSPAHGNLGGIYMLKGEYEEAEKELLLCLRYNEPTDEVYLILGDVYTKQGKYKEALDVYKNAQKVGEPTFYQTLLKIGLTYENLYEWKAANKVYADALKWHKGDEKLKEGLNRTEQKIKELGPEQKPTGPALDYKGYIPSEKEAMEAALAWLGIVDNEQYEESWESGADYLKNVIPKENWVQSLRGVRTRMGKVTSRELKTREYTRTLVGAPDGDYVVIQYETSFENKQSAIETVTPMVDKDGKWRVSGYYIR